MIVYGTNNNDTIDIDDGASNSDDIIFGLDGNDVIFGLGDSDHLLGENGDDVLFGGAGGDVLDGGIGIDTANYEDAYSAVKVSLVTGAGIGTGSFAHDDKLINIENLTGSVYSDRLTGDKNDNVLAGLAGNDHFKGEGGNDTIIGGLGADTIDGGGDFDTASYEDSAAGVKISLIIGTGAGGYAQGDKLTSIENLVGSKKADQLWGDNGENVLSGLSGDDILKGIGGDDTLLGGTGNDNFDGGAGDDVMTGDVGNDTYNVDSAGDKVNEGGGAGNDTVFASVSYQLASLSNVETLRTNDDNGTNAIDLTGNGIANTLVGNAGVNILDGKGGADIMSGLGGNDTYYVDHAKDFVNEIAAQGGDTVRATVSYQLKTGKEVEALTTTNNNGVDEVDLTGNGLMQTIVGNAGANILQGLGGDDYLQGRAGNDTLVGGAGADKFLFNTALNAATNVDTITDMTAGIDIIRLDDAFFAGIGAAGVLNADAFHIGAAAADAQDRIVYNSATGQLFFDSNGNAAGGSTLFANLATGLALSNTDFHVV